MKRDSIFSPKMKPKDDPSSRSTMLVASLARSLNRGRSSYPTLCVRVMPFKAPGSAKVAPKSRAAAYESKKPQKVNANTIQKHTGRKRMSVLKTGPGTPEVKDDPIDAYVAHLNEVKSTKQGRPSKATQFQMMHHEPKNHGEVRSLRHAKQSHKDSAPKSQQEKPPGGLGFIEDFSEEEEEDEPPVVEAWGNSGKEGGEKSAPKNERRVEYVTKKKILGLCGREEKGVIEGVPAVAVNKLKMKDAQLRKIRKRFARTDRDLSGSISDSEFMKMLGGVDSHFMRLFVDRVALALLHEVGSNEDQKLTFDEFVFTTCMVCTMNKEDMLHILFEIFDVDNNEQISVREFRKLCAAVSEASDAIFPGNYSNMLEKFDRNHDGALSFKEFVQLEKDFPMVFFPAFHLQMELQRQTLGVSRWDRLVDDYYAFNPNENFHMALVKESMKAA